MLVEMAIGDAYGAAFEFFSPSKIDSSNDLQGYYQHPTHLSIKPGQYTDDTRPALSGSRRRAVRQNLFRRA
jgi:ADP-ribosyl-[dinitrogen reductase] hydrolase